MITKIKSIILLCLLLSACSAQKIAQKEAREDAAEYAEAKFEQSKIANSISPDFETVAVESQVNDDAADDPAIWYNQNDPTASMIIGSDKISGIYLYDLQGLIVQFLPVGRINNVDVRECTINSKEVTIIGGSNRSENTIQLFTWKEKGKSLLDTPFLTIPSDVDEVYGFTMHRDLETGQCIAFVNGKSGAIEGYQIQSRNDALEAVRKYAFKLKSQPEGMVVDNLQKKLYVGEENVAVHIFDLDKNGKYLGSIASTTVSKTPNIRYDIEGLALFKHNGKEYLILSSQGNFTYAIIDLSGDMDYVTSFKIEGTENIDGVEETDGIEIVQRPIGKRFPNGILVVQDGFNFEGEEKAPQNYKVIDFSKVLRLLPE